MRGRFKILNKVVLCFLLVFMVSSAHADETVQRWCSDVKAAVDQLKWNIDPCKSIDWKVGGTSVQGRSLIYAEFGDPKAKNTTLVFSKVHGDEITPLYFGLMLAELVKTQTAKLIDTRVVIAPLVNPDGFFKQPRTRVNANGVDINRNFATEDWGARALQLWKSKFKSDPRRFPGKSPRSEPETVFQEEMIKKIKPQKILSIHSPLNFLDYDGPGSIQLSHLSTDYVKECMKLRKRLKAISGGFFPGSLGNYAGHLGIPTVTVELRSSDPRKAELYWKQEQKRIQTLIEFSMPHYAFKE